ncbi:MAG: helix-turn-helix domain-containing protein [Proteobacteria bacterium]|nr:helix-turn-helix domain-containing protein [Pseudomonadota bacterium]
MKARLRLAGTSLAQVARDLNVQPTTVTAVSLGVSRSRRIEKHIATVLATTPDKLWPERYDGVTAMS